MDFRFLFQCTETNSAEALKRPLVWGLQCSEWTPEGQLDQRLDAKAKTVRSSNQCCIIVPYKLNYSSENTKPFPEAAKFCLVLGGGVVSRAGDCLAHCCLLRERVRVKSCTEEGDTLVWGCRDGKRSNSWPGNTSLLGDKPK